MISVFNFEQWAHPTSDTAIMTTNKNNTIVVFQDTKAFTNNQCLYLIHNSMIIHSVMHYQFKCINVFTKSL